MNLLDKVVALENTASEFGFEWETTDQIMKQIQSECAEINEHLGLGVIFRSSLHGFHKSTSLSNTSKQFFSIFS